MRTWMLNIDSKYTSETEQKCTDLLKDASQNIESFLSIAAISRNLINHEMYTHPADRVAFLNFYLFVSNWIKV
jgi:hypothetical protein